MGEFDVVKYVKQVRVLRQEYGAATWGFVPTMGYLHEGHISLIRRAAAENERVAVSIFVNPTQFGPDEDLRTYPRDLDRDFAILEKEKVDFVFMPSNEEMYPSGYQTSIKVAEISKMLEGASRPTHFVGVATVVAKLLNIVQPTRAYFGQKDAQQVALVKRLVADLNINTDIRVCPIVREPDGLALSSRNKYLSPEERRAGVVLSRALAAAKAELDSGNRSGDSIRRRLRQVISSEPLARIDYVSVSDPMTMREVQVVKYEALVALAVYFGRTRLIDNLMWRAY